MKDKITFGNFIRSKRKESGLSQKELAEKLYVTESAVSKWERGISYPDITMISGICEALNISEHELCTASEDENQRKIERMAEKYKKFIIIYNAVLILGYLSAIIPCFIVFVIREHMPSKFFILLTSLMMTASVLNIPVIADKNKALISFGSFYLSLNLLFLSGSIYSGTHWFLMAFLSVFTGVCIVFLPFIIRTDLISGYIGKNKALVCMTADTVSIMLTVIYGTLRYGSIADMRDGIFISIWGLSLAWIIFAVFRYVKINAFFRISISFLVSALYVFFANTMISLLGISGEITIISSDPDNIKVSLTLAVISVISAFLGMIFKFKRRNFFG